MINYTKYKAVKILWQMNAINWRKTGLKKLALWIWAAHTTSTCFKHDLQLPASCWPQDPPFRCWTASLQSAHFPARRSERGPPRRAWSARAAWWAWRTRLRGGGGTPGSIRGEKRGGQVRAHSIYLSISRQITLIRPLTHPPTHHTHRQGTSEPISTLLLKQNSGIKKENTQRTCFAPVHGILSRLTKP